MKKIISIFALLVMVSIGAGAQWYLFPLEKEKKAEKVTEKAEEKITEKETEKVTETFTARTDETGSSEIFELEMPGEINLTMLLPIQTSGKTNTNFLEMYSGGLMALRDLGKQGLKVNLSVFDSVDEDNLITPEILAGSDVIIGPVSSQQISKILTRCPEDKRIVSPLEPKAASMADSCHIIQAPSSWEDQIDGMIAWLKDDYVAGDNIVLVKDSLETSFGEHTHYLLSQLKASGLKYKTTYLASDIAPSALGCTRYLVASDRDSYIATAIRQIGIEASKGPSVSSCIYLTSKMRNAKGIDQQYLYKARAKVTMSYFTDYNDDAVKNFILAYRSLFQDEPTSFAFQGYDTVKYFAQACAKYGRMWYMKLPETELYKGLQSNFEFKETDKAGQINKAIKRVVYNQDMSTSVQ